MKTVRIGRFQFQNKTKEQWLKSKVTLLNGELAIESDTSKIKIGDGKSLYSDLDYITIGEFSVSDLTDEEKENLKGDSVIITDTVNFPDGRVKITFSDGTDVIIPKGDKGDKGVVDWSNITEEQKQTLIDTLDIKDSDGMIALSHLSDPGKDLVDKEGKLYRGDVEVGVRVKNAGTTYTIPETVQKARIFFKAQCEEPTFDNWIFFWVGDGQDESERYVSELENRTRHYSTVVDLSKSHEIVISTVQAWDKTVKIWDFDWKEAL